MTCVIAYKDKSNHVWMASDRCVRFTSSKDETRDESLRESKCILNNGVLLGGAGNALICDLIKHLYFPKPYLKNGSYNHYVSNSLMRIIITNVEKWIQYSRYNHAYDYVYFILAIKSQLYYCLINYNRDYCIKNILKNQKKEDSKLIYLSKHCKVSAHLKDGNFAIVGNIDSITILDILKKHPLYRATNDIDVEQFLISILKDVAEVADGCNSDIDVINNDTFSW